MSRILRVAAVCCFLCAPLFMRADTAPDATPVVRALENHYHNAKTLKAAFLQTYRSGASGVQVESGTVYFSRPGRMRWEYESPETKLFLADGKSVWFFVPADHTVTHSPMKESDDWRTPLALLTGKAKLSQLCDQITGAPAPQNGHTVLTCIPRGQKVDARSAQSANPSQQSLLDPAPYDKVFLEVDSGSGQLADVRILQVGGIELEFRFGNWQQDIPLQESLFHFQKPPGVTVVEEAELRP